MNKVVGKDISVVGFDDNQFSSLITPGLTTIKQNIDSLCSSVINELFNNQKILLMKYFITLSNSKGKFSFNKINE